MSKTAVVQSNDPRHRSIVLRVSGQVERFANIQPRVLRLKGKAGQVLKGFVRIIPEKKYPFRVLGTSVREGKSLHCTLSPLKGEPGGYRVDVENRMESKGRSYDYIILNTDSKIQPQIRIAVYTQVFGRNESRSRKN
jgi:hypothetical protein